MKFHQKNDWFFPKKRIVIIGFLILTWTIWLVSDTPAILHPPSIFAKSTSPCIEVRPAFGSYKEAFIKNSGLYCITVDFWQQRLSNFAGHSGPTRSHYLLGVRANDVVIDMANHTLHSDGHSSGIVAVRIEEGEKPIPANITIKNGVIDLKGLGTAIDIVEKFPMDDINPPPPKNFSGFKKSNILLENLLIKTDNVGIMLEGDGNIIRNCVIESSGDGAIMMAGRNSQILNNTIILKEPIIPTWLANSSRGWVYKMKNLAQYRRTPRAAIALHQATGTIISGNRIEVEGKSPTRHNIYLTDASIGVRIEHNTIVGADNPVTLMMGSTAELKSNMVEKRPEQPWWPFK